jgi:GntR family transcriptional repressor for pyruvate dehydrogenase complex
MPGRPASSTGDGARSDLTTVQPIKRGYEQVADQIRLHIEAGLLPVGTRLPSDEELAQRFSTSRQTVREALRLLAAWNLVRTRAGRRGGTFVSSPNIHDISNLVGSNVALLTSSDVISLESLLEVRELLEVPAAGLAAERNDEKALADVRHWMVDDIASVTTEEQTLINIRFHIALVEAARNPMLLIAYQPLLQVLSANLDRTRRPWKFRVQVRDDHRAIIAALEARNPKQARELMSEHLRFLRPYYQRAGAH